MQIMALFSPIYRYMCEFFPFWKQHGAYCIRTIGGCLSELFQNVRQLRVRRNGKNGSVGGIRRNAVQLVPSDVSTDSKHYDHVACVT